MYEYCIFDNEHKLFTYDKPKNTFVVDNSNGYPVKVTTNVTGNTSWTDILKVIMITLILIVLLNILM